MREPRTTSQYHCGIIHRSWSMLGTINEENFASFHRHRFINFINTKFLVVFRLDTQPSLRVFRFNDGVKNVFFFSLTLVWKLPIRAWNSSTAIGGIASSPLIDYWLVNQLTQPWIFPHSASEKKSCESIKIGDARLIRNNFHSLSKWNYD